MASIMFNQVTKLAGVATISLVMLCRGAYGQYTFTDLHLFSVPAQPPGCGLCRFTNYDGLFPGAPVVLTNGTLFGTAEFGGANGVGTVFRVSTNGAAFTTLHAFIDNGGGYDGDSPAAGLTLYNGLLYGTTSGGNNGVQSGTIFRIAPDGGGFTNLHYFLSSDSEAPSLGSLTVVGSQLFGGTYRTEGSTTGTIYRINPDGTDFTVLHEFSGPDGDSPWKLTLSANALYGVTQGGGAFGCGTIFQIGADGTGFTNIWNFTGNGNGAFPVTDLVVVGDTLYGTTRFVDGYNNGNPPNGYGTIFKVGTNGGNFTVIHTFSYSDGDQPAMIGGFAVRGKTLYGTTSQGGRFGNGTIFQINTDGSNFDTLYSFSGAEGYNPDAGLIIAGDTLYGTASLSNNSEGAIFAFSIPPRLELSKTGNGLVITWSDSTYVLQLATNVVGPWTNVANAASPYTNGFVFPQEFFRLIR